LLEKERFEISRSAYHRFARSRSWKLAKSFVQAERTLDEAYYPSLDQKALRARNNDQVVSKECKILLNGNRVSEDTKPILMVPQLWIWQFGAQILSAFSTPGESTKSFDEVHSHMENLGSDTEPRMFTIIDEAGREKNFGISIHLMDSHPDLHIGLLLAAHIENFGKPQANDKYQSPLDIFEIGVCQIMSRVAEYIKPPTSAKTDINRDWELPKSYMKKDWQFMHDISDIRSELVMIDEILRQQEHILGSVIENVNQDAKMISEWRQVKDAKQQLAGFRERVKKIDRDAERVEKVVADQLNLQRTYAAIRDTRTSVAFGAAVIGFTIITVIFTPLSFMASLFALPIDKLVKNQVKNSKIGDTKIYTTNDVGKWFSRCTTDNSIPKANPSKLQRSFHP
jgi:hypothetical protein